MKKGTITKAQRARVHLWCDVLESGFYQQTDGCLKNDTGYCCLGVACEVFKQQGQGFDDNKFIAPGQTQDYTTPPGVFETTLPPSIFQHLGMPNASGFRIGAEEIIDSGVFRGSEERLRDFKDSTYSTSNLSQSVTLIALNDDLGFSFKDIAHVVRYYVDFCLTEETDGSPEDMVEALIEELAGNLMNLGPDSPNTPE